MRRYRARKAGLLAAGLGVLAVTFAGVGLAASPGAGSPTTAAVATPTVSVSPSPSATSAPGRVTRSWLTVVDRTRWTVSDGHVLAHSRTLRTLILHPPTAGRHPLIVFCHGYDITPMAYLHMLRHWAAAGFMVAAPYFPLTRSSAGRWLDENDVAQQPKDVSVVLTAVERRFGAKVDRDGVVVAGHSDGGSTAFAAAFADRVRDRWGGLGRFSEPRRRVPMLLVQSDRDEFNPLSAAARLWAIARAPKIYLHLHGARHLPPFSSVCAWRPIVEAVTTDFLRAWTASRVSERTHLLRALDRNGSRARLSYVTDDR
jgi:pimeloyl-ACP methyl ester carboxylesterase